MHPVFKPITVQEMCAPIFEAAGHRLADFWEDNVEHYFNRSERSAFPLTKSGKVRVRLPVPNTNVRMLRYSFRPVYNGKEWKLNMRKIYHSGVEYGIFLIKGTPDSPGTYIPEIRKRSGNMMSTRKGTSSDQWNEWREIFGAEVTKEMEITASECAEFLGDLICSNLDDRDFMSRARKSKHTTRRSTRNDKRLGL